jgi:hypothetical protein
MPDRSLAALGLRARRTGHEAAMAARLARDLPGWLRRGQSFETATARVQGWLAHREYRFLANARRYIFEHPTSPYLPLLRHAGCEYGDAERLVRDEGLEGALSVLAARGVYLTFDEFKGRREVVRGSTRFLTTTEAFDHPTMRPIFVSYTGGTRGIPQAVMRSVGYVDAIASSVAVVLLAHGLRDARHAFWVTNPLPLILTYAALGQEVARWFRPLPDFPWQAWLGTRLVTTSGALAGRHIPVCRHLDPERVAELVRWIDRRPRDGRPFMFSTLTSMAVRVALAAREAGIDLTGVTFRVQSEPLTPAREAHLRAVGARVIDNYAMAEAVDMGFSCGDAAASDDLHVMADRFALITRERPVLPGGPTVDAMLVTALSDVNPKIVLNVETGDYARIAQRDCGCFLGTLGLTTHLSQIRSFEKLSAEGVTFVGTALAEILESTLPARFGGTPLDYQLLEEEAADSFTRLVLRVSPSVGGVDEVALRATFLAELARGSVVDRYQSELLRRADSLVISRQVPLATAAGKIFPFHLLRTSDAVR